MIVNVVSVRVGSKYGPEYVERLHDMVGRNLSNLEQRHWCVTDDPASLPEGVTPIPHNPDLPGWWQKVFLFSSDMPWKEGERILYMDLDCVVTGRLEELVERKGQWIIQDWHWPCYNSSVMTWNHGDHARLWGWFNKVHNADQINVPGPMRELDALLPKSAVNGGDQEWITWCDKRWKTSAGGGADFGLNDHFQTFPPDWCVSYTRATLWPPEGCKVVVYHGETHKPHLEPAESWIHDVWKVGGFTSLPEMTGMNVTHELALANVAENVKLDVDWFTGGPEHSKTAILVCGGPSMKDHIREIRDHKLRGAKIVTVNNALRYLMSLGIKPDHHIILDARPDNVEFLRDAPEGVRYFLASQVDPSLFAALRASHGRHDVILWHNAMDATVEQMSELLAPIDKPPILVPGGCTVGLRALTLLLGSGYRKVHVYGMDSSYTAGEHHAYSQALNDGEATLDVVMGGKHYVCARWMARQAGDFQKQYPELVKFGMQIWVHGTGLIPDIWRALRAAQKEAA